MASKATKGAAAAAGPAVVEFFDIASKANKASWSPNTARTRMVLNFKRIPHRTTFLSYPDIAGTLRSLGVAPSTDNPHAGYTCPAIRASSPDATVMMDSWPIALHLDRTFDTDRGHSSIFPTPGALPLAKLVHHQLVSRVLPAARKLALPKVPAILDERGADYFRRTRREWLGKPLDELCDDPEGEWRRVADEIAVMSDILSGRWSSPAGTAIERTGPFFLGSEASYADFILVAFFQWFKCTDEDDWERLISLGKHDCFKNLWLASEQWLPVQH